MTRIAIALALLLMAVLAATLGGTRNAPPLLAAGAEGKRYALPNARIMVHQPSGGAQGQATDIEIQAREILSLRARLNSIYVKHTKQSLDVIEKAVERDRFMSPEEARDFGLVDEVVVSRPRTDEGDRPTTLRPQRT